MKLRAAALAVLLAALPLAAAQAQAPPNFNGNTFKPFSWTYGEYQTAVTQPLSSEIIRLQGQAALLAGGILTLDVVIAGFLLALTLHSMQNVFSKFLRVVFVIPLATNQQFYQNYVVFPVVGVVSWLGQAVGGGTTANSASVFDAALESFWTHALAAWANVPWGTSMFFDAALIAGSAVVIVTALVILFCVWIVAQALTQIVLLLGPILLLGFVYDYTREIVNGWISAIVFLVLFTFCSDILAALFLNIINAALAAVSPTNSAVADLENLVGVAIVVCVMSGALVVLPLILAGIARVGGAPSMGWAQGWLSRNVYEKAPGWTRDGARRSAGW